MSSKVDEACEKIVEYLNTHGEARWSDLHQLGIPKTTLYRALGKLLSSGIVKRDGRVYVLTEKDYVAIVPTYAKQICDLIECGNLENLTKDLMDVGASVRAVERAYIEFTQTYLKTVEGLGIQKLLLDVFRSFYGHRGFFILFLLEMAKIYKGLKIIEDCDVCEVSQICPPVKSAMEAFTRNVEKLWNIKPEVFDEVEKVGTVLKKHGYTGSIKISVLGLTSIKINLSELILTSLPTISLSVLSPIRPSVLRLVEKIMELGYIYYSSGCRPLGNKEKENLIEFCKQLGVSS
ncbi:MAG: hypothetical protein QXX12_02825 [Nanopusillaceae archaeon]